MKPEPAYIMLPRTGLLSIGRKSIEPIKIKSEPTTVRKKLMLISKGELYEV